MRSTTHAPHARRRPRLVIARVGTVELAQVLFHSHPSSSNVFLSSSFYFSVPINIFPVFIWAFRSISSPILLSLLFCYCIYSFISVVVSLCVSLPPSFLHQSYNPLSSIFTYWVSVFFPLWLLFVFYIYLLPVPLIV